MTEEESGLERFRQQVKAEKEAAILRTAVGLFYLHGLSAISMQKIADHASCSSATVYAHFKSKEDLFGACIEHIADWSDSLPPDINIQTAFKPAAAEKTGKYAGTPSAESRRRAYLFMRRVADNELRQVVLSPERVTARLLLDAYLETSLKTLPDD